MPRVKAPTRKLSTREQEVVRLLAWGATHKEIATALNLSVKTVETHKANAARKLRVRTRQELVRYAVEHGWLAVEPITALERRIAALKNELAAMKAIVVQGLHGWSPGQPVSPQVNQAFRRVLEIGSSMQEAAVILDQRGDE